MKLVRPFVILFLLSSFMLLSTVSCGNVEPERKSQPEGFRQLVEIYSSDNTYELIDKNASGTSIHFCNGIVITLAANQIVVDDCTVSGQKVLGWTENGEWMVDGMPTGVYKEQIPNVEALPVYICYDKTHLYVYLSNNNHFIYDYVDPETKGRLPQIYLTTENKAPIVSKEDYVKGNIKIENPDKKFWNETDFSATMKIRGRGNSTWGMPKKPWKIKLDDKARLFDMSNDKEWCLLANHCDKSLVRNFTAMEISRRLGFKWTPKMVPVEVYLNGAYQGVYAFCEHKKVSKERVNIDTDSGDILFELEENQDEPVSWWTEHGAPVMFNEPSEPDAETEEFAKKWFKEFEDALWAKDFKKAYEYIDVDSFINNFIIQELTKNVDGNLRKSTFLTLEKSGKLEMYFVWDFDISMGNCDYYGDGLKTWEGWWIKDRGSWGKNHGWYYRLFMDPDFVKKVKARWSEVYPQLETIPDYITKSVNSMQDAPARNFTKWNILNQYVWPNAKVTGSYKGEVEWLQENYKKRLDWLNTKIKAL